VRNREKFRAKAAEKKNERGGGASCVLRRRSSSEKIKGKRALPEKRGGGRELCKDGGAMAENGLVEGGGAEKVRPGQGRGKSKRFPQVVARRRYWNKLKRVPYDKRQYCRRRGVAKEEARKYS